MRQGKPLRAMPFIGLVVLLTAVACKDDLIEPKRAVVGARATGSRIPVNSIPAEQLGMGGFEGYALHVARAMQDKRVRKALASAMRDPANRGLGIDFTDCKGTAVAAQVLDAGERRGGRPAAQLCSELGLRGNMVLYMNPQHLAVWDGSTIPIVTALAGLNRATPPHLMAYRSPTMLIDIGADDKLIAPTLVVVPMTHPTHWPNGRGLKPPGPGASLSGSPSSH